MPVIAPTGALCAELDELSAVYTLIAELDWVIGLLDRGDRVSVAMCLVLFTVTDAPQRLGRFATAAPPPALDALLAGLGIEEPTHLNRARAQTIVNDLREVTNPFISALTEGERRHLGEIYSTRVQALSTASEHAEMLIDRENEVEIELVIFLAPGVDADQAQGFADEAETRLGYAGEFIGYEFNAASRQLVLSIGGVEPDAITQAVLPGLRAHAGTGSYFVVRHAHGDEERHGLDPWNG
jgi:hypothetical protein